MTCMQAYKHDITKMFFEDLAIETYQSEIKKRVFL